jgi:hypothetical protein
MRIISATTTTTTTMRTTGTMTAKTMVTVAFLLLAAIFTTSPYSSSSSSSSSSFVLLVQAQEYDGDAKIPDNDDDPIAKIRQQQYEKVLGTPKDQQQQQSLCGQERLVNKECRNEMLSRYGDEEDANDTRQSKFIMYGTEKELRNYCLELSHLMSQCKIKGIYHSTLDREQNAAENDNEKGNNGNNNGNDNTITNQLGETVMYGDSPKQIEKERIELEKVALEVSEWRWNIGIRGMMIVIILYALFFDAPFKDNKKVVVPTTTAANADADADADAANATAANEEEEREKEEELKDPTDKKKD